MKPNKRNIKKWVDALRSGEFKQSKGALKRGNNTYCCLGVACEISGKIENWSEHASDFTALYPGEYKDYMTLPPPLMTWLGIGETDPILLKKDTNSTAADLNDRCVSFKRIAYYIERKYLKE